MKESKRNFDNRELTDDCFGVWKLERDDSYETPTIKHHENQHDEQERLGFEFARERERLGFQTVRKENK